MWYPYHLGPFLPAPTVVWRTTADVCLGPLLWGTGLLVRLSSQGRRLCPSSRDMGPLGQGRLQDSSGRWTEVALVSSSAAVGRCVLHIILSLWVLGKAVLLSLPHS